MSDRSNKQSLTFAFVDEVGIGFSSDQPLFGVGILFIQDTLEINRQIHDIFTGAVSAYRTNKTRFEFKFNAITDGNLRFYKSIVETLAENKSWQFSALLLEKNLESWDSTNYWPAYLTLLEELLMQSLYEKVIIVADYLAKPKELKGDLSDLLNKSRVMNFLQLESQGSLLLQVADILLGALHFEERNRVLGIIDGKESKVELAKLVDQVLTKAEQEERVNIQKRRL